MSANTISNQGSAAEMLPRELTLIVAATNTMGIGLRGTLPWTGLKKEMAYFARVTKRAEPGNTNTVIMGRKTWESIPPRFRPLKGRSNIVITRSNAESETFNGASLVADSLQAAIASLNSTPAGSKAFVIGGAQIYKAALELEETKRILLTKILKDYECDAYFPVTLDDNGLVQGWAKKSKADLDAWAGENVPEGIQTEADTSYVFEMWEKVEQ